MLPYKEKIRRETSNLSERKKALHIVLTCEKLFFNYQFFSKEANWGNSHVFKDVILLYYEFINGNLINTIEIQQLENAVEINTPDLDEVGHPLTSYGFDAGIAFLEALGYLKEKSLNHMIEVISGAINTVDMFVQVKEDLETTDKNLEIKIDNDPFMQKELKRQETIIKALQDIELNPETIAQLRKLNNDMGEMIDFSLLPYR